MFVVVGVHKVIIPYINFSVSAGGGAVLYTAAPLLFKEKLLYLKKKVTIMYSNKQRV